MKMISYYFEDTMPVTLGQVRAKVVLLSRFKDPPVGVPLFDENMGKDYTILVHDKIQPSQMFYFQDARVPGEFQGRTNASTEDAITTKWNLVEETFTITNDPHKDYNTYIFNYASAICYQLFDTKPDTFSVSEPVKKRLIAYLDDNRTMRTGFLIVNFMRVDMAFKVFFRSVQQFR